MIYEIAQLPVDKQHTETFRQAFDEVVPLLRRAEGYQGHLLAQGIETPDLFHLIVQWRSLEDHTPGFEASEDHQTFPNSKLHCHISWQRTSKGRR